ncbi:phosphate transport system regulatory protein PhoU [Iodidimonas muriae]|uniref:Phosphate-specific transport system accessory protein PhoU n=1 Tax=Iodidimonas muriae TaxID=261467 RepID=A0ABQ2L6J2_9PROT|nr:phosphate signaling complex protein PhoU [Iodidimonas muriae]GER06508.1 phosphate transport system regulatory protein PhoU [Kordiimonadales bacterium JCM 17843]GGO05077.1 phosphate transport system regulatory protein PhoU [Iodidimonas muriae]
MTDIHTIKSYDDELDQLRAILSEMAGLAEMQLANAVTALMARDIELAEKAIASDKKIDLLEQRAEEKAIEVIARRAPLADDLRELVATIKISNALERIGDYSKNIAKRTTVLVNTLPIRQISVLPEMAQEAQRMITDVLDAFIQRDSTRAIDVWTRDERIDLLYDSLFRELLTYMMEKPQIITACTHLLFIAKNIERAGDQATNIAEIAYYVIEGRPMKDARPKRDDTAFARASKDEQSHPDQQDSAS